jgi:hypothetical protein
MSTIIEMLIISAFCIGLYLTGEEGMIFHRIKLWLENKINEAIFPAIWGCAYCMASFWGSIIYWSLELSLWPHVTLATWVCWPVVCVGCVFLNGFLYEHLRALQKNNSEE